MRTMRTMGTEQEARGLNCGKLVKSCGPIFEDHADLHVVEQITWD
jgi:hypothetical protein